MTLRLHNVKAINSLIKNTTHNININLSEVDWAKQMAKKEQLRLSIGKNERKGRRYTYGGYITFIKVAVVHVALFFG